MNLEKVVFAFFIVLSLTLNFGFFIGELDNPDHHNVYELFAALIVSLIATIMKFGDRAHIGATNTTKPPARVRHFNRSVLDGEALGIALGVGVDCLVRWVSRLDTRWGVRVHHTGHGGRARVRRARRRTRQLILRPLLVSA